MYKRTTELTVGIFIALGMLALFFLALRVSNLSTINNDPGYLVTAHFQNVGGLKSRSPVTIAGVPVGRVHKIDFDPETFEAVVTIRMEANYHQIPDDTFAKILTSGLLGEQYIGLDPGGSDRYLKDGSRITLTQSALVLEEIIGQVLFSKVEGTPDAQ
jgi:phospholipid/cholesterol/gamma-HCH transport system substrate-binding protein